MHIGVRSANQPIGEYADPPRPAGPMSLLYRPDKSRPFTRVPDPGVPVRARVSDALVEPVDLPATAYALTGIEPRYTQFGRSLLPGAMLSIPRASLPSFGAFSARSLRPRQSQRSGTAHLPAVRRAAAYRRLTSPPGPSPTSPP